MRKTIVPAYKARRSLSQAIAALHAAAEEDVSTAYEFADVIVGGKPTRIPTIRREPAVIDHTYNVASGVSRSELLAAMQMVRRNSTQPKPYDDGDDNTQL